MTIGSLFSGIGGLELGLERAGLGPVVWQAECDPFCRAVLEKHWPGIPRFPDVREVKRGTAPPVRVICGGFPCQPVSVAGKRQAQSDARWLWPEYARIVAELKPSIIVAENVPGLRTAGLRDVLADLAALGFDAEWIDIRASDVGAPHRRERIFLVATHPNRIQVRFEPGWLSRACWKDPVLARWDGEARVMADANSVRELQPQGLEQDERGWPCDGRWWATEPNMGRVAHGVPARAHRLRALGNAVVPQVAEVIGRAIAQTLGVQP